MRRKNQGQGNPNDPTSPRMLTALDKQRQALQLRIAGATYDQIAKEVGYTGASGAWKAIQSALKKTIQEPADELRQIELARLDRMMLSLWEKVREGHLGAMDRVIKIMQHRADLTGMAKSPKLGLPTAILLVDPTEDEAVTPAGNGNGDAPADRLLDL